VSGRDLRHNFVCRHHLEEVNALDHGGCQGGPVAIFLAPCGVGVSRLARENVVQVEGYAGGTVEAACIGQGRVGCCRNDCFVRMRQYPADLYGCVSTPPRAFASAW
jgi:hypothetical protein